MSKEEILELIDELAARLEGPAKEVFRIAAEYHFTQAVIWATASGLFLLLAIAAAVYGIRGELAIDRQYAKMVADAAPNTFRVRRPDSDPYDIALVTSVVVAIPSLLIFLFNLHGLMSPEFNALKDLVPGL